MILTVVEQSLLRDFERICQKRETHFASPALPSFNIGYLVYRQFAKIGQLLLPHIPIKTKLFDTNTEIWLNWLHSKSVEISSSLRHRAILRVMISVHWA